MKKAGAEKHIIVKVVLTEEIKPGVFSTTFHFPEIIINNITATFMLPRRFTPNTKWSPSESANRRGGTRSHKLDMSRRSVSP
ncbi:MAG: hypothetical protein CMO80_13910 [Verrucomicrobiales bacterium]|nr:hypothetical protein [Verrucomicrobiales bacterium]|tara:strand:- start:3012 stop:3257 length:246 start_codon:yes stop_codon:yes gene_type:complete